MAPSEGGFFLGGGAFPLTSASDGWGRVVRMAVEEVRRVERKVARVKERVGDTTCSSLLRMPLL